MIFISFWFYVLVAVLFLAYYVTPIRHRWIVLLVGSLGFYFYLSEYSKKKLLILIAMAFCTWIINKLLGESEKHRKLLLICAICASAVPLLVIKDTGFVMGITTHRALPEWWIAPIGISFFSLQLISYSVDVFKGTIQYERNFLKFLLFASYFPQIVQGPIPRYSQLSGQLYEGHRFDEEKITKGFMLIIWGFFLKLCLADKAAVIVDTIFDNYETYKGAYVLIGGVLYSLQLYADFLSCTTFAQGVSALFGIELVDNFNHPYFATSIKDFWRRWHISLSSWLRDYIYIPLGGNRKGIGRKYINVLITFFVSGVWHGAGFNFLFWGLLHGLYQVIGELLQPVRDKLSDVLKIYNVSRVYVYVERLVTFFLVMLAWIIFRVESLTAGLRMIASMFTVRNPWIFSNDSLYSLGLEWKEFYILIVGIVVLICVSVAQEKGYKIRDAVLKSPMLARWFVYICAILVVMIFGTYGWGFDAQDFIYGGF
ncbi:D-alanyl-lipoteichoic acid acyltransferase DltB, MBOAT superfamily [Pseudobutyrivibrio sp. 49]|uniref:MBOAT family O-acyltransferase n=1 Tax=Pseudobutyrivibrio sp. 49 TaxID=1855344 RepID=UPI00088389DE|nr:MBOAT family O-acyltransferase [Pseudobutyrivibrio sp. 49]SDH59339.1 D-alanyl-lipoteichoic acid acyltransferase DltB, MBOAT superfamily [Pseudobutyrivibrio sp. 49]